MHSQFEISLCYVRDEGQVSITAAPPSFPVINAELSHARAEFQAAISALDLYIISQNQVMYFMCVT